jgi:hypothetical protein
MAIEVSIELGLSASLLDVTTHRANKKSCNIPREPDSLVSGRLFGGNSTVPVLDRAFPVWAVRNTLFPGFSSTGDKR